MIELDPTLPRRLRTIESIALISRIVSTNLVARRVAAQCVENDNDLPTSVILAAEQHGGRGRGNRTWHSPAGKGIYATVLFARPESEISLLPFEFAVIVARYLEEVYGLSPRLKWPNDVLVEGRKVAGILIEGRSRERIAYMAAGIGINVETMDDPPAGAVSIAEVSKRRIVVTGSAIEAFLEILDDSLGASPGREEVLDAWRKRSIHEPGDSIECRNGEEIISGHWAGIDDEGRALVECGIDKLAVSSGDLLISPGIDSAGNPTGER